MGACETGADRLLPARFRTGASDVPTAQPSAGPPQDAVMLRGNGVFGEPLVAWGRRSERGIELVDPTTPTFDAATGRGGIETIDQDGDDAPVVTPDGTVDAEALSAHVLGRFVYDYWLHAHGRRSWDGQGASLISYINYGGEDECNAFFDDAAEAPRIVYGDDCVVDDRRVIVSEIEIDTAAHEITHGVISTSSNLVYSGQPGSLNEGFADYFGNVIGDRYLGRDSDAVFERACEGMGTTAECIENPDGSRSLRYLLTGATLADYLYVLDLPDRFVENDIIDQDDGGVHVNSAVLVQALWSIRRRLADADGTSMLESPLVTMFDGVVYRTLTEHIDSTASFLDVRAALEAGVAGLDTPVLVRDVVREELDRHRWCACVDPPPDGSTALVVDGAPQLAPTASATRTAWVELVESDYDGDVVFVDGSGERQRVEGVAGASTVGLAGGLVVIGEWSGAGPTVRTYDPHGRVLRVADEDISEADLEVGIATDEAFAAWTNTSAHEIRSVDANGAITSTPMPSAVEGELVSAIGAGGGSIVVATRDGSIVVWRPGGEAVVVAQLGRNVVAVDVWGDRVATASIGEIGSSAEIVLIQGGVERELSNSAAPFGLAMSDHAVVWAERVGPLGGRVAEVSKTYLADTDLYVHRIGAGTTGLLLERRGQQGFPHIASGRVVWQDAAHGGDDVSTMPLGP